MCTPGAGPPCSHPRPTAASSWKPPAPSHPVWPALRPRGHPPPTAPRTKLCCRLLPQTKLKPKRVKALYNCVADNPDELTFSEGDVIVVDGEEDHEWWVSGAALPEEPATHPHFPGA